MNIINFPKLVVISIAFFVIACDPASSPYNSGAKVQQASTSPESLQIQLTPDLLAQSMRFNELNLPSYVSSVRGLAAAESFGRWSVAKLVLFDFKGPLPDEFEIEMMFGGYGPNIGANLEVIVGAEVKRIKIKSDLMHMQAYTLRFSNPERASSIALVVPYPSSPQALGKAANDPRMLGIALQSIIIKPIQIPESMMK
jgi:hypothetical protein